MNAKPTTREDKEGIRELDERKASHISQVNDVRHNGQHGRPERKSINQPEDDLDDNDRIDQSRQEALRDDAMLLDKLRQVVKARGNCQSQEAKAQEGSGIADKR